MDFVPLQLKGRINNNKGPPKMRRPPRTYPTSDRGSGDLVIVPVLSEYSNGLGGADYTEQR